MRPKVLLPVVLMSFLLLALFAFVAKQPSSSLHNQNSQLKIENTEEAPGPIDSKKPATQPAAPSLVKAKANQEPAENDTNSVAEQHQLYVEKRIDELMDLAMTDEPQSLNTILSELTNRDPDIRKAALEAAKQFGSRDAIPKLMDVVSQVDDPKEKHDILDAIEFLKTPSATEVIAQAKGTKATTRRPTPANSLKSITLPAAVPK